MENPRSGLLSNTWRTVNTVGNSGQKLEIGYTYASSMFLFGEETSLQLDMNSLGRKSWSNIREEKEKKQARTPQHACGFKISQNIFIVMGGLQKDRRSVTSDVFQIDMREETTEKLEPLKQRRAYHSCAPVNRTHIMVSGGKASADSHLGPILHDEVYDIAAATSREVKSTLVTPRYNHKLIVLEDSLYALGGRLADNSDASMVEKYDPVSETWSQTTSLLSNYTGSIAITEFPQSSLDCVNDCDCGVSSAHRIIGGRPTQVPFCCS